MTTPNPQTLVELYGTDLAWLDDLDPSGREIGGLEAYAQRLLHRLDTARGMLLHDDENFGEDVAENVSHGFTPDELAVLPRVIASELEKDEQTESVTVEILSLGTEVTISFYVSPKASAPFRFVGSISKTKTALLEVPL